MVEPQQPNLQFLTWEEAAEVDKALLTSSEKFSTRIAIYALRVLKQIAQQDQIAIDSVTPEQVKEWIEKDPTIQQQIDLDTHFERFFSRLVVSSLKPLKQAALENQTSISELTIPLVVQWFEQDSKVRREQENLKN